VPHRRVAQLSKGELTKLAVVIALSHRPALLILDEPTSGLDPIVRHELLDLIRQHLRERPGSAALLSTHILSDLDRVADQVAVMREGHIVLQQSLTEVRKLFVRASFVFDRPPAEPPALPGAVQVERSMRECVAVYRAAGAPDLRQVAVDIGARDVLVQEASLDDAFMDLIHADANGSANGGKVGGAP
jgi:ABC-2 type transport system ATP-binding protein